MKKIIIFSNRRVYLAEEDLENQVNDWIFKNDVNVLDFKFARSDGDFSVMLIYETRGEND